MARIANRGHEIGVHPSYRTYRDPARTKAEFESVRDAAANEGVDQNVWGGRQHYLRWSNPDTWQNWTDAGLSYDSTLGYPERPGFRCGVCREFSAFNLLRRERLALRERPLVVMDESLFGYMKLDWNEAADTMKALNDTCRRWAGDFTLLWHNSSLLARADQHRFVELCRNL
jgi:hypothetical protein